MPTCLQGMLLWQRRAHDELTGSEVRNLVLDKGEGSSVVSECSGVPTAPKGRQKSNAVWRTPNRITSAVVYAKI